MRNVTPWFLAETKPIRVGVYERRALGATRMHYSLWDGRYWIFSSATKAQASNEWGRSAHQHSGFMWRGLAEQP